MKIGFSGKIFAAKLSGNGYYLYRLLQSLLHIDEGHQYTVFLPGDVSLYGELQGDQRLSVIKSSPILNRRGLRAGFEALYVPYKFGRLGLDVLHMPTDGGGVLAPGGVLTVSLMGIAARHFPQIHPTHIRVFQRWSMAASARAARLIFTISESSKRDLVEMFGVPPDRIKVTYLGVDSDFYPRDREGRFADQIRTKYGLPQRYILYLGNLEPRKNITSLIKAYVIIQSRDDVDLVIAGKKAWMFDEVFRAAKESGCEDRIYFTDYVDGPDLPWIYSMAEAFVFPSLFEGFGLPNLEAMACGTPVISSNISSIPEVVGDAGILVNPLDVDQIADAVSVVLSDRVLSERLRNAGVERARSFTWMRTAQQTLDGYRLAYGSA